MVYKQSMDSRKRALLVLVHILMTTKSLGLDPDNPFIPDASDRNVSRVMAEVIKDDLWRGIIENQLLYCPYTDMCSPKFTRNLSMEWNDFSSCCTICACSKDCKKHGSCCPTLLMPDAVSYDKTLGSVENFKDMSCTSPQVWDRHFDKQLALSFVIQPAIEPTFDFMMMNRCPINWPNDETKRECERESFLTLDSTAIKGPVTNGTTIYRNTACALCNGLNLNNLHLWNMELRCLQTVSVAGFKSLKEEVLIRKRCNILFIPPKNVNLRTCEWGKISTCNVTGLWEKFDSNIKKACLSYTSVYKEYYRNVFCYMCNNKLPHQGYKKDYLKTLDMTCPHTVSPAGGTKSLTALLDFSSPALQEETEQNVIDDVKVCQTNEMFDAYSDSCLRIECKPPTVYDASSKTCKTNLKYFAHVRYNMYIEHKFEIKHSTGSEFKFGPNVSIKNVCVNDFADAIWGQISKHLSAISVNQEIYICSQKILVSGITESTPIEAPVLISHISLFIESFHDFEQMISSLLNVSLLHVNVTFEWCVFKMRSKILPQHEYPISIPYYPTFCPSTERSGTIWKDGTQFEALQQTDEFFWSFVSFIFNANVSHTSLCPLVRLHETDYHSLEFNETNITFPSEFTDIINGTDYYVCMDKYIDAVGGGFNFNRTKLETTQPDMAARIEGIVSILCSSISIVSLLITIITYILFESLRTAPGLNNMSLAIMLLFANILFSFSFTLSTSPTICLVVAILTHFCWMSSLVWMNVCCIHMTRVFMKIKKRTTKKKIFFGYLLYSIMSPVLLIATNLTYSHMTDHHTGYGGWNCFITKPELVLYTFALPIGLIVISNLIMFIVVIFLIKNTKTATLTSTVHRNYFVVYVKLSTLTGCSWVFGFIHEFTDSRILAFLFVVSTASQGLFLMVAFICNKRVFNMYADRFGVCRSCSFVTSPSSGTKDDNTGPSKNTL